MKIINNRIVKSVVPYAGLIVLFLIFAFTTDNRFIQTQNLANIIGQAMVTMIAACGCTFVMAHNNLDFSLGGGCALIAAISYLLTKGQNLFLMLIVCMITGVLCGLVTAVIHVKGNIPAFMAGMCIMFIGRGCVEGLSMANIMNLQASSSKYANNTFYFLFLLVVFIICAVIFNYTQIGKAQKLIGSNPNAAKLSGINVGRYKTLAFVISGTTLGIATFLNLIRIGSVTKTIGNGLEVDVLIALTLGGIPLTGGTGTRIRAALIGTLTYYILSNGLTIWGLNANIISIVKGIIFLLTVYIAMERNGQKYVI